MFNNSILSVFLNNPIVGLILAGGLILSLTVHEFCHALAADKLGDPTPRSQGRLTLNPLAHLDPMGTLALFLVGFGWGKPVQFDPYNLKNPVREAALIAIAGPISNFVMAIGFSLLLRFGIVGDNLLGFAVQQVVLINLVLGIFNFVPVAPLDGSKIILAILPKELAYEYEAFMHQFGFYILLALIFPWYQGMSPISFLINPVIQLAAQILL